LFMEHRRPMSQEILQALQTIVSELINCDEAEVTPEARLVDDLGFESIDFLELAMTLGNRYRCEVDEKTIFLSDFRPLISGNGNALERLEEAYPHLDRQELQYMLEDAPRGNVLKVKHLISYLEHNTTVKA
ncbi:MAG: acyl carrier protein, partial [Acidobacteriota bacterium]